MDVRRSGTSCTVMFPDGNDIRSVDIAPLPYHREPPYLVGDDYPLPRAVLRIVSSDSGSRNNIRGKLGVLAMEADGAIEFPLYDLDALYAALVNLESGLASIDAARVLVWARQQSGLEYRHPGIVPCGIRCLAAGFDGGTA